MLLNHVGTDLEVSKVGDCNQLRIIYTVADKPHAFENPLGDAIKETSGLYQKETFYLPSIYKRLRL
jgi:hypothetical protein